MLLNAVLIGAGGTLVLDLWNTLLNRLLGYPLPDWAMVGRWFGHMPAGRFIHAGKIANTPAIGGERAIGWIAHYLIGIVFALATMLIWPGWEETPTLPPALIVGWVTILCGWLMLSPGLGNGIAHAATSNPARARLLNIAGHTIFGLGMWATAIVVQRLL